MERQIKFDHLWKRPYSLYYGCDTVYGVSYDYRKVLKKDTAIRLEESDGWVSIYSEAGAYDALKSYFLRKIEKEPKYVKNVLAVIEENGEKWIDFVRKQKVSPKNTTSEIVKMYKKFSEYLLPHTCDLWISFCIVEAGEVFFNRILDTHLKSFDREAVIDKYSVASKKAHLAKISEYFKKNSNLEKRANYVKRNFPWIFSTDIFSGVPSEKQYAEYASSFKTNDKKVHINIKLTKGVLRLIKNYQETLYLKDKRDEYRRRAFYYAIPLVEETMRRFKMTREDLWYVLPSEIKLLEKNKDLVLKEIEKRKSAFIFELISKRESYISGNEAKEKFIEKDLEKADFFKGITGSRGKVQGTVRLVFSAKDMNNFKQGEILVSVTTNPEFILVMQKASAFITDEGGITCHAAIVAREMQKPCVVGIKFATKTLKNGDLVEVDADNGMVKIIKL